MSDLENFEVHLRRVVPLGSGFRPFVCDGDPTKCEVALVGYNPASSLEADFWDFWDAERGFQKRRWFEAYLTERRKRPLKPGKTRRHAVSPTRRRIERFVDGLGDRRCIETNLHWDASEDIASHYGADFSNVDDLLRLLPDLQLIVCHHKDAFLHLEPRFPGIRVLKVNHFNCRKKGWGNPAAYQLGLEMREKLVSGAAK